MTMRKMLAVLATLAIMCAVLPLSTLFSAVADSNVIENTNFDDGDKHGWSSSSDVSVEDGVLVFSCTKDWANVYKYANGMKANTDYVYTFRAKANMSTTMNIKINDNWASDSAHVKFDVTTEWQEFTVNVNSGNFQSAPILMFSANVPASTGLVFYLDYVTITEGSAEPEVPSEPDAPADGNLIVNGDFETGDASGWETWQSTTISAAAAKDGAYGAHLVGNGSWGGMLNQTVTVVPGNEYKLSFWINVNATGVNVQVKDGAGASIEGAGGWFDGNKKDKLVEWTFIATDDKVFINFCGSGSAPEDVYVDNFSLICTVEAGDQPVDDGLIKNGGFENEMANWENLWGSCTVSFVEGYNSSKAISITAGSWSQVRQLNIPVDANSEYELSAMVKDSVNFGLIVKNGDDSDDIANVVPETSSEWAKASFKFNTGDQTVIRVLLIGWDGGGSAIIDDVTLVKVGGSDPVEPDEPDEPAEPDEPVTPPATGDVLNATFDSDEFDGIQSSSDIAVEDGVLTFNVSKDWGNIYTGFNVEKNTDYEITLRAKSKLAKSFWVKLHKGDWTGDIAQADLKLTKDWAEYTFTLNTGDNDYAYLLVQYAGYAAEGEVAYFDYITVKKAGGSTPDVPASDGIVNGGFENGSEGWELGSSASITDEDAHSGKNSLKLENPGMWAAAAVQKVPVKPDTEYVVEMWVYRVSNKGAMNLFMMDAADNRNLTVVEGQNWFNTNTSDWEKRTIVINTGAATEIVLKWSAEAANAGILLIDDMTIYEKNAPQPPASGSLVVNGDFETGDTSGWEKWQSTVVTEEAAKNGKYGVNLIGDGGWGGLLNQTFAVENGETYVITLWICPNTGGANLNIKGADKVEGACDNTWMTVGEINGWTKRTFNVVANSDEMTLNFCGGGNNIAADLYLDDIVVTKKGAGPVVDETYPIKNAGFETGDLTNWTNLWNSCTYSFDTPGYKGSNFALNFEAPGQWQQIRQDLIPVEPNTDYVVVGYVKNPLNVNIVVKTEQDTNINEVVIENDFSNKWIRAAVEFNSADQTKISVLLIGREAGATAIFDDVQIYKKGEEPTDVENDDEVTEGPISLDEYGVAINRPAREDANLIANGSFEDAEGGQWQSIISDTLYVVDDETAPEGNKSLFFNTSGVTENNKVIFYVDVEPNTDYVFSAWVKGAFISADNRFNATFGVTDWKDNFCVYQDAKFSNKNRQIVPTAWDNEWHLRSVQFNSGSNIKVGIGFAGAESQMWIDGIALYEVIDGIKYTDPRQNGYIMPNEAEAGKNACADENNLIVDSTMGSADAEEFWSGAEGYKNGFISFPENEYEYGTSLKYTGDEDSCYTNAIKWFTVEPHTDYTFSVDMRVVKSGGGSLDLLDGKKRECQSFLVIDFDQYAYGAGWNNIAVTFNSGEFDRIGIAIVDGGGEALLDNMRLFKSEYAIAGSDEYIEPPYSFDDPEDPADPSDPDSPATGVSALGAALAVALVPSSAFVAFKLRGKKKEDEE